MIVLHDDVRCAFVFKKAYIFMLYLPCTRISIYIAYTVLFIIYTTAQ